MLIPFFCNGNPKIWKNERTWDVLERCIEHSFALSTFPGAVLSLWSGMPEQLHVFSYSHKSTIGQYTHAPLLLVQPGAISVMLATSHTGSFSKMLKPKKLLNWNKVCIPKFKVLIVQVWWGIHEITFKVYCSLFIEFIVIKDNITKRGLKNLQKVSL